MVSYNVIIWKLAKGIVLLEGERKEVNRITKEVDAVRKSIKQSKRGGIQK
jgi:hypothetical protein